MTVIAGYTNGNEWAIGGDSGGFNDDSYLITTTPKVWQSGDSLIGGSGSFYANELAERSGIPDPYDLRDYLMSEKIKGDWFMLVVTRRLLYEVDDNGSVIPLKSFYHSLGSDYAVGFMGGQSGGGPSLRAGTAVLEALKFSEKHDTHCKGPFKILKIEETDAVAGPKRRKHKVTQKPVRIESPVPEVRGAISGTESEQA